MKDLSHLADKSLAVTSQGAGNMIASNAEAQTAPGSAPVDNLQNHLSQVVEDPAIEMGDQTNDARQLDRGEGGGSVS